MTLRFANREALRMLRTSRVCDACVPWEKFNRAPTSPSSNIFRSVGTDWLEGPIVAMIFVRVSFTLFEFVCRKLLECYGKCLGIPLAQDFER